MKKFLVLASLVCVMGVNPIMADDDHEQPRRGEDGSHEDGVRHHHHHRGLAFSYYSPGDVLGGIGGYAVGVTTRIGRGALEVVAAPFTTAPVMGPPRSYMYYPPRIQYTGPSIRRFYPPNGRWHWHRH